MSGAVNRKTVHSREHSQTACSFCGTTYIAPGLTYYPSGTELEAPLAHDTHSLLCGRVENFIEEHVCATV